MTVVPWMVPSAEDPEEVKKVDWFVREPKRKVYHLFQFDEVAEKKSPKKGAGKSKASLPPKQPPKPKKAPQKPPEPPPVNKEVVKQLALLKSALKEIDDAQKKLVDRLPDLVLKLGLAVAEELARGAIDIEPNRVLAIIRDAVGLLEENTKCLVRIHPEIHQLLEKEDLLNDLKKEVDVAIQKDASIDAHGCIVESKLGRVDAQVSGRLNRLRYILKDERQESDQSEEDEA